ncbi:uncharacterized protein MELLADRAFT_60347 [Melampsora larici-populina 98AG31]|uniref:Uncharacterized protein n=1 Tax=Melampsora larici-populina (strain 98AG31 / pathotype 3-4-7) TaxID=747676 RepID=F4RB05_MELLP|nr:uncharacterized protein MELLADRAFT_60347 [Melampsora larici-populina 98AG31]EGG10685.1 hypothetical protein MELLADRAFT_60347 [Melampsora larici-populina 98AG31]
MARHHQFHVEGLFNVYGNETFDPNGRQDVIYHSTVLSNTISTGILQETSVITIPPPSHDNFRVENGIHILAGSLIDNGIQQAYLFCQQWDSLVNETIHMSSENLVNVVQVIGAGWIVSVETNGPVFKIATSLVIRHRAYNSEVYNYTTFEVEYEFKTILAEQLGADNSFIGTEITIRGQMLGRNPLSGRWIVLNMHLYKQATEYSILEQ